MLKTNNAALLKAIAMSALLTNGSIGTDREDRTGDNPHIRKILGQADEREKIRLDMLRQPRTIDLAAFPLDRVLTFLNRAKQYSAKVKLTLLNVTEEDLDRILNDKNAGNIEKLDWTYQPMPVSFAQDPDEADGEKDSVEDNEKDGYNVVPSVEELLGQADEREQIRRDMLATPITVNLEDSSVEKVLKLLKRAKQYSAKLKLTLLNITKEDLDRILNDKNAGNIEKLDWTYQPMPVSFSQVPGEADGEKDSVEDNEKDGYNVVPSVEELLGQADEREQIRRDMLATPITVNLEDSSIEKVLKLLKRAKQYSAKVKLNLLNITKEDLDRILNDKNADSIEKLDWTYQPIPASFAQDPDEVGGEKDSVEDNEKDGYNVVPFVEELLDRTDEREQIRRDMLATPITVNLEDSSVEKVLKHLKRAKQYSAKVNLTPLNVTEKELDRVLNDDNADSIEKLDWTYQSIPASFAQDPDEIEQWYIDEETTDETNEANEEKDKEKGKKDNDTKDGEPKNFKGKVPHQNRQNRRVHPKDINNLQNLRRAAARALWAPTSEALMGKTGKGAPLDIGNAAAAPNKAIDLIPVNWSFTPVGEDMNNPNLPNGTNPSVHVNYPSHNLVHIFCRKDPEMVQAR